MGFSLRTRSRLLLVLFIGISQPAWSQVEHPLARWSFDENHAGKAHDSVGGIDDPIAGYFKVVPGVMEAALRLDGESTVIRRASAQAPKPDRGLTIQAFIAVNAYPWNWVPIVDQSRDKQAGYFFGIDASGRLSLQVSVKGVWQSVSSSVPVPLREWADVAGVYDPAQGIKLYLNGKNVGQLAVQGGLTLAPEQDLLIGRVRQALVPTNAIHPKYPVWYSFDGILDDLRIYGAPLSDSEIQREFAGVNLLHAPRFRRRFFPRARPGADLLVLSIRPSTTMIYGMRPGESARIRTWSFALINPPLAWFSGKGHLMEEIGLPRITNGTPMSLLNR